MKKRYFIALGLTLWVLYITHHGWMGYKNAPAFDPMLLIIISVLSYLAGLKITSYLADFKNLQHKSRIEIIFLAIFFIFLFIPMSKISQDAKSETENRYLAKYKPLITKEGQLNLSFGKDFENWFNDRFAMRKELNYLNARLKALNGVKTNKTGVYFTRSKWMFLKSGLIKPEIKTPQEVIKQFSLFNDFCNKHNIKLYVLIIPSSPTVYKNYASSFYDENSETNLVEFINELQDTNIKIIYPLKELRNAAKKDFVFFKTDWHWTEYGAYTGYRALFNEIQKDFPELKPVSLNEYKSTISNKIRSDWNRDFHEGEMIMFVFPELKNNLDKVLDTEYTYYTNKNEKLLNIRITDKVKNKQKNFYYPYGSNLKALEIGTSMNENLTQFTPYNFKHLKYIRLNNVKDLKNGEEYKIMKYYRKRILNYKPNLIIFCITETNLGAITNLFKE